MSTVRRNIVLPKDVDGAFRRIVARLEGPCNKGSISKWITRIIRDFITNESKQQQSARNLQSVHTNTKQIQITKQLMKQIVDYFYWSANPQIELDVGSRLRELELINAIEQIKSVVTVDPKDHRTAKNWIKKLVEYEFLSKGSNHLYEVLATGKDWGELETDNEDKTQVTAISKESVTNK